MMWWNHGGWGVGDWLAMSVMMVVFWGLVVALVVRLVHGVGSAPTKPAAAQPPDVSPDAVLAVRFAQGEIDAEEFTARRELLNGAGREAPGRASGQP